MMKKRMLSVVLVSAMLFTTNLTAFASEKVEYDDVAVASDVNLDENM